MIHSLLTLLLLATTIFSPGCSHDKAADSATWSIDYRTSGGFAGGGNGNLLIESDGRVTYQKPGAQAVAATCTGRLSKQEVRELSAVLAQTKPGGWKVNGLDVAAPDAYGYVLVLHKGDDTYQAKWYDNTREKLPGDLKTLAEVLDKLKESESNKCTQR